MSGFLSQEEQDKFLNSMRWDQVFRVKVQDFLFDDIYDRDELARKVADDIREDIKDDVGWGIKDISGEIRREIERDLAGKVLEEALERGIKIIQEEGNIIQNRIVARVANQIATNLLDEESNKFIKKKVEEKMMKMRTYRADLLDLDDE